MPTPFIAEIRVWAGNFPPTGWALCNGQVLPIASYTALFSLIGTTYGGNGSTTFALPDLRGRAALAPGQGPGLSNYLAGEAAGLETVTLTTAEIPVHTHAMQVSSANGTFDGPSNRVPAGNPAAIPQYGASDNADLAAAAAGPTGGDQPHNNMQPYLTLNFIIALIGIYPSRS